MLGESWHGVCLFKDMDNAPAHFPLGDTPSYTVDALLLILNRAAEADTNTVAAPLADGRELVAWAYPSGPAFRLAVRLPRDGDREQHATAYLTSPIDAARHLSRALHAANDLP